jgi:RNA polymerase sigma-70 factor (ECF subfamily)
MGFAIELPAPSAPRFVAASWQSRRAEIGGRERAFAMSSDSRKTAGTAPWGRLIEAVATRQDRAAFAVLFEHFAPRVKSFMRRSGATDAVAEELAQETLLTVWRKSALFSSSGAGASAWIFTIARNLRIDAVRRERRGDAPRASDINVEYQADESVQPDSQMAAAQSELRVRAAMAELSEEQSRVVELSFYEEKAHAEIAQILQIPLGTVKSRLRLAMNRLRGLLGELA